MFLHFKSLNYNNYAEETKFKKQHVPNWNSGAIVNVLMGYREFSMMLILIFTALKLRQSMTIRAKIISLFSLMPTKDRL